MTTLAERLAATRWMGGTPMGEALAADMAARAPPSAVAQVTGIGSDESAAIPGLIMADVTPASNADRPATGRPGKTLETGGVVGVRAVGPTTRDGDAAAWQPAEVGRSACPS